MSEVTHILAAVERGDADATEQLLPLVYDELRRLAAVRLAGEKPGNTPLATDLVHLPFLNPAHAHIDGVAQNPGTLATRRFGEQAGS